MSLRFMFICNVELWLSMDSARPPFPDLLVIIRYYSNTIGTNRIRKNYKINNSAGSEQYQSILLASLNCCQFNEASKMEILSILPNFSLKQKPD